MCTVYVLHVLFERKKAPREGLAVKNKVQNYFVLIFSPFIQLLHLPPFRFHCVGGCWDQTQDCCDFSIDSQTHVTTTRIEVIHARLDLIHNRLNLIHTRQDLIHNLAGSHSHSLDLVDTRLDYDPHTASYHPQSARSHQQSHIHK